jgi:hypothetical protein
LGQTKEAIAQFQTILDHRALTLNSPIGSLVHLSLGRALVAGGDKLKARTSYQNFFALWKDADPDIPILVAAKAEYAKLQWSRGELPRVVDNLTVKTPLYLLDNLLGRRLLALPSVAPQQ